MRELKGNKIGRDVMIVDMDWEVGLEILCGSDVLKYERCSV